MAVTRRDVLLGGGSLAGVAALGGSAMEGQRVSPVVHASERAGDRDAWIRMLMRVSHPVLESMAKGDLQREMPVELSPGGKADRAVGSPLEAFGRLLSGIAPWLELEGDEGLGGQAHQQEFRRLAVEGLVQAVDPRARGYLRFGETAQTLVDAAFLSLGLLRAPKALMATMSAKTREQMIAALVKERAIKPGMSNWLLFSAMNEALLFALGAEWKREPVEFALRKHAEWYKGDGVYGDGAHFHFDYYNSFVIQPFMLQIADTLGGELPEFGELFAAEKLRAVRYAAIQERLIGPDGTYPVVGRSIAYRCGAFHHLADVARREMLPEGVRPEQVRCALGAVMERTLGAAGTFDEQGWLRIGLAGHQPSLGETYISTGSLYLCAAVFLPLGLPREHAFWSGPEADWTSRKVWSGVDVRADHAMDR